MKAGSTISLSCTLTHNISQLYWLHNGSVIHYTGMYCPPPVSSILAAQRLRHTLHRYVLSPSVNCSGYTTAPSYTTQVCIVPISQLYTGCTTAPSYTAQVCIVPVSQLYQRLRHTLHRYVLSPSVSSILAAQRLRHTLHRYVLSPSVSSTNGSVIHYTGMYCPHQSALYWLHNDSVIHCTGMYCPRQSALPTAPSYTTQVCIVPISQLYWLHNDSVIHYTGMY